MPPDATAAMQAEILELKARLEEAEETLRALRSGEVDAIVTSGPGGDHVYTLKGADEAYRIMVEEMGEGAVTLSPDGLILFSNKQFAEMLGRPQERVMGERLADFVAPEDAGLFSELLSSEGKRKAEVRLRTFSGPVIPVYLSFQNVLLNGTQCRCVIVTDLSDQKRHEEIAAVLEAVPAAVFIAQDAECRSIVGNRTAYELLRTPFAGNISKSALEPDRAKSWREVRDGRELPAEELPMQTSARTGRRVESYEFDMLFDDGVCRSWLGNAVPLFDEAGKLRGAVGAFIDITERRRTEEALAAANLELRNFGSVLTQDLRDSLSMVVKFTKMLAEECRGKLGKDAESWISDALGNALRIEDLLTALVDYWNVTERSGSNPEPVDCNEVLLRTLYELREEIQRSGATITSGVLPTVAAEEPMLRRLFGALLSNAIQYRSEAAPAIHISAENTYDRWLFSVRDNGIGIDPKYAAEVFGLFRRLHGNEIPGNGIGLAMCKQIVEHLGGRIWVEPSMDGGAAFRFTIPMSIAPLLPEPSAPWPNRLRA